MSFDSINRETALSAYRLGWRQDITIYSKTLMDKTFVCHDISPNGSGSIFLAYLFILLCKAQP